MIPVPVSSFVLERGLTVADLLDKAGVEEAGACVMIDVERTDTASGSVNKFMRAFQQAKTPGTVIEGHTTPIAGGVLHMAKVGVVVRDETGARVHAPPNARKLPTLYAPLNGADLYAAFGGDLVARLRVVT